MQHIPRPVSFSGDHMRVPYLGGIVYDGGEWLDFPRRQGWDPEMFLFGDFNQGDVPERVQIGPLLQAWLYFGFMIEVMMLNVHVHDFVEVEDGGNVVTTKRLLQYIDAWQERVDAMTAEDKGREALRIDDYLRASYSYFTQCISDKNSHDSQLPLPVAVRLSISMIHATISLAKVHIFGPSSFVSITLEVDVIKEHLLAAGWCESDVEHLSVDKDNNSAIEGYYCTLLGPRLNRKQHPTCVSFRCMAFDTREDGYQVRHLPSCSGCEFLATDMAMLQSVYSEPDYDAVNGPIPLLEIKGRDKTATIHVTKSLPTSQYVAISHVFGDGLGNPKRCALPSCQLFLLQKRVDEVMGKEGSLFWIDSLVLPQQPQYLRLKKTALYRMTNTYRSATVVLVLNREVEGTSINAPPEELAMRIATNSWMRRIWTLQEGFVARELVFQFSDGAVGANELIQRCQAMQQHGFRLEHRLMRTALLPVQRLEDSRTLPPDDQVRQVFSLIAFRSTSYLEDETLVLSTLMGMNTSPAVEVMTESEAEKRRRRWREWIISLGRLPFDILFFIEARISLKNLTWCPQNFSGRLYTGPVDVSSPLCRIDTDGLHVTSAGIVFVPPDDSDADPNTETQFSFSATIWEQNASTIYRIESGFWCTEARAPRSWAEAMGKVGASMFAVIPKTWPFAKEKREPIPDPLGMSGLLSNLTLSGDELSLIESALPGGSEHIYEPFQRYQTFLDNDLEQLRQSTTSRELPTQAALVGVLGDPDSSEIEVKYCGVVMLRKLLVDRYLNAEEGASGVLKDGSQRWCVK